VTLLVSTRRKPSRLTFTFSVGLLALGLAAGLSFAQDTPPPLTQAAEPAAAAAKPQGGDSASARLSRVEQKLAELQALVGALQSFTHANPGTTPRQDTASGTPGAEPPVGQSDLATRVAALETQIGALTAELEQISQRLNAVNALPAAEGAAPISPSTPPPARQGEAEPLPDTATAAMTGSPADAADSEDTSKPRWYGPRPGEEQTSALPPGAPQPLLPPAVEGGAASGQAQSQMAALPGDDVHSLYEKGYAALTRNDYTGAEVAFRQLIESYPKDPLAANAQYWIGESYYRRGQYKNAADAFRKGYKKYKSGDKAPDTLLKLGISLAALGQKDAACSTFGELKTKFPKAPETVRDEAKAERKKTGC
jgi:tol-pal system protein YbgF